MALTPHSGDPAHEEASIPTQGDQLAKDILLVSFLEQRGSCFLEKLGRRQKRHSSGVMGVLTGQCHDLGAGNKVVL